MYQRILLYSVLAFLLTALVPYVFDANVMDYSFAVDPVFTSRNSSSKINIVKGTICSGDVLFNVLMKNGADREDANSFCSSVNRVYEVRRIKSGNEYELAFNEKGGLENFRYRIDIDNILTADKSDEGAVTAAIEKVEYDIRVSSVTGTIETSLFGALSALGDLEPVGCQIADIFSWSVDFYYDLRKGDRFTVLYEEKYSEEGYAGTGRVLAAELVLSGEKRSAFIFKKDDRWNYFDEKGRSLKKQFLKMPVPFGRISSGFSHNRFHPVLKRSRPHLGVDYAAPHGTPILATADGIVESASYNKASGKYVRLKHGGSYITSYSHMSRYASGIKKGAQVSQGQTIGYIGMTGYSTGPHVDYRLKHNGLNIDPRKFKSPGADPINDDEKTMYFQMAELLKSGFDNGEESPLKIVNRERIGALISGLDFDEELASLLQSTVQPEIRRIAVHNGQFQP